MRRRILTQQRRGQIPHHQQSRRDRGGGQNEPLPKRIGYPGQERPDQVGCHAVAVHTDPHGPGNVGHGETGTSQPECGGQTDHKHGENGTGPDQDIHIVFKGFDLASGDNRGYIVGRRRCWMAGGMMMQHGMTHIGGRRESKNQGHGNPQGPIQIGSFPTATGVFGITNDDGPKLIGQPKLRQRCHQTVLHIGRIQIKVRLVAFQTKTGRETGTRANWSGRNFRR